MSVRCHLRDNRCTRRHVGGQSRYCYQSESKRRVATRCIALSLNFSPYLRWYGYAQGMHQRRRRFRLRRLVKKYRADAGATTAPSIAAAKAKIAAQRPPLPFNNRKILISIPQRISTQNLLHYTQKSQNCKIPTPKPKFYKFPPPPPEKNKSGGMIWLRNGIVRLRNKIKKLRKKTQRLRNRMQRLRKKSVRLRNQTKKLRKKTQRLRNRMQWLRNKMKKLRNGIVRLRNKTKKSEKPLILQQKYFRRLSFRR